MKIEEVIGKNLKEIRLKRKLTQEAVAAKATFRQITMRV